MWYDFIYNHIKQHTFRRRYSALRYNPTLTLCPWQCVNRNYVLCCISVYCYPCNISANGSEQTLAKYQGLTVYTIIFVCQSLVVWAVDSTIRVFIVAAILNVAVHFFKFFCVFGFLIWYKVVFYDPLSELKQWEINRNICTA